MDGWRGGDRLWSQLGISSQRHLGDVVLAAGRSPGGSCHTKVSFVFAQRASYWTCPAHTAHVTEPTTGVASDSLHSNSLSFLAEATEPLPDGCPAA